MRSTPKEKSLYVSCNGYVSCNSYVSWMAHVSLDRPSLRVVTVLSALSALIELLKAPSQGFGSFATWMLAVRSSRVTLFFEIPPFITFCSAHEQVFRQGLRQVLRQVLNQVLAREVVSGDVFAYLAAIAGQQNFSRKQNVARKTKCCEENKMLRGNRKLMCKEAKMLRKQNLFRHKQWSKAQAFFFAAVGFVVGLFCFRGCWGVCGFVGVLLGLLSCGCCWWLLLGCGCWWVCWVCRGVFFCLLDWLCTCQ